MLVCNYAIKTHVIARKYFLNSCPLTFMDERVKGQLPHSQTPTNKLAVGFRILGKIIIHTGPNIP